MVMTWRWGLRVQVLGPVRAWRDGRELDLGPAGRRAVLALLALSGGRVVPRADLVDALWGERPPVRVGVPRTRHQTPAHHRRHHPSDTRLGCAAGQEPRRRPRN